MSALETGWQRIPVIVRAPIIGAVVCLAGTVAWSILLGLNLKFAPSIPWAAATMTVLLWVYWSYLGGKGWPRSTAETRRASLRVRRVSGRLWIWALIAGALSVASIVNLQLVYARFVRVPSGHLPDFSRYPFLTVFCALLMSAAVAGFMEEAGFRGYMQVPIERQHGPWIASVVVAILFVFWHLPMALRTPFPACRTISRFPSPTALSLIYRIPLCRLWQFTHVEMPSSLCLSGYVAHRRRSHFSGSPDRIQRSGSSWC